MVYHIAGGNRPGHWRENPFIALDGDFEKVRPLDETQDDGRKVRGLDCGRPVAGNHMPTRLRRGGTTDHPLMDAEAGYGGTTLVDRKFKDIVESFEPGVHQFFPMAIERRGKVIAERFLFVIGNRLDTLHRDLCVPPLQPGQLYTPNRDGNDRRVFDLRRIGNRHAWHDKFAIGRFVSDALFDVFQRAAITGLGFTRYDQAE